MSSDISSDISNKLPEEKPRETRLAATNRWTREGLRDVVEARRIELIKAARAAGANKKDASEHAWSVAIAEFPPPGVEPRKPDPIPKAAPPTEPPPESSGLSGLGNIPADWPELVPNASLSAEVQWVQANRLLVRVGESVDLSLARSPAPSHSALSWLETAILFPSKFADVAVKVTQHSEDEREVIRRERLSVEEVRGILLEMLDAVK